MQYQANNGWCGFDPLAALQSGISAAVLATLVVFTGIEFFALAGMGLQGIGVLFSWLPAFSVGSNLSAAAGAAAVWFMTGQRTISWPKPSVSRSPYQVRIDPKSRRGPQGIDTAQFSSGEPTKAGGLRNKGAFWKAWSSDYPETLSPRNLTKIGEGMSPNVDDVWVQYFPEHAPYMSETIEHHRLDLGPIAIPLPRSVHRFGIGWGIWHNP
jgi:hypothetical protein